MPSDARPHPDPEPPQPRSHHRLSPRARTGRAIAIFLLVVWIGPVSLVQSDPGWPFWGLGAPARASAEARVVDSGQALEIAPGTRLELHMRDGSRLSGRYLGRTLLDSTRYAGRFAAFVPPSSESRPVVAPFALGETLTVSLRDGRQWIAPFEGYGELAVLLHNPDRAQPLVVPLEFATSIRRSNGEAVDMKALDRALHAHALPSAEALVVTPSQPVGTPEDQWASALRVPVQDILSASYNLPGGGTATGSIVVGVLVGGLMTLLLVGLAFSSLDSGCRSGDFSGLSLPISVRLTTRPFDRVRGCYVGDPPLAAAQWPASSTDATASLPVEAPGTRLAAR